MEPGLPDPKRQRVGEAWQGRNLPPLPTPMPTHGPPPASPSGPPDHLPHFAPSRPLSRPPSHPNHFVDERRPEIGYPQYQDPHRPPSTVPHPYSPQSAPREFNMKRDPGEEHYPPPPPPPNRSLSNGHMPEHHPSHAHHPVHADGLPRPQMINYDPAQTSGSNTPTTGYRIPPFGPTPMPQAVPYDGPPAYGPPTTTPMQQPIYAAKHPSYNAMDSQMKTRKSQRASQACDQCRTAKGKCDEQKPCQRCQENGFTCTFRPPAPKVQDKVQSEMMETLSSILTQINQVVSENAEIRHEQARMRKVLEHMGRNNVDIQTMMKVDPDFEQKIVSTPPMEDPLGLPQPPEIPDDQPPSDEEEGADPGPLQTPQFDISHTTYATNLLSWSTIKGEVEEIVKNYKHKERYLLRNERDRGIIKTHGAGEGLDYSPGYRTVLNVDKTNIFDDDQSETSSPRSDGSNGRIGDFCTPTSDGSVAYQLRNDRPGGLSEDGKHHKLDFKTVERLSRLYMENINIMHPIITPARLDSLIQRFYKSISSDHVKTKHSANLHSYPINPQKRKFSPEPTTMNGQDEVTEPISPPRSINTALLFLILALGKVADHKEKIPDVIRPENSATHSTPRNGVLRSPYSGSPASAVSVHGRDETWSPIATRRLSNDGSRSAKQVQGMRNMDVIPGFAYYATASDILGNQAGAYTLQHVHANLLCGLYLGQLGRVLESYTYIFKASSALQVILRPKTERLSKHAANNERCLPRDNPIVFAFWTCLQLEADILAELPLPYSGILAYEDKIPYPNCKTAIEEDRIEKLVGDSYIAQLYLRKLLNNLHGYYRPGLESKNPFKERKGDRVSYLTMDEVESKLMLLTQAEGTHPYLLFEENDPPSDNILGARLRAKFFGAQVVLYRPFIKDILEENFNKKQGNMKSGELEENFDFSQQPENRDGLPGDHPLQTLKRPGNEPIAPEVLKWAKTGIEALIHSTEAFHGLGDGRLIVTNVFGTAHAQWGNLLVLTAVYNDPVLSKWIDKEKLQYLYAKTLHFLAMNAQPHSALASDIQILMHVGRKNHLIPSATGNTPMENNTSFSSQNGAGPGT